MRLVRNVDEEVLSSKGVVHVYVAFGLIIL